MFVIFVKQSNKSTVCVVWAIQIIQHIYVGFFFGGRGVLLFFFLICYVCLFGLFVCLLMVFWGFFWKWKGLKKACEIMYP